MVSIFKGEDEEYPYNWLCRVKWYVVVNCLTEKLNVEVLCSKGEGLDWHEWENARMLITMWIEFRIQAKEEDKHA